MFSHVTVGSNDLEKAKTFYDAVFGVMGAEPGMHDAEAGRLVYSHNGGLYMICRPIDGNAACHANGGTIGFAMPDADTVKNWHDAGVAAGGTSVEDAPGPRDLGFAKLYLAYMRDPDGNKLCGMHPLD